MFVLLTFGGWNEAVYVSAELRAARRRMAPVLVVSLLLITVLYLFANAVRNSGTGSVVRVNCVSWSPSRR